MTANYALISLDKVWMLESEDRLSAERLQAIDDAGFSRVPVYKCNKHNLRGFILVKKLITISSADDDGKGRRVDSMELLEPVLVRPDIKMLDLLNRFQEQKRHIA